jgi:peptide/nickel transport system substrate-binding protein
MYSFEVLCTERVNDSTANLMFSRTFMDRVVGANAYYEASKKGKPGFSLEGVKVIDDYTVSVTLTQPSSSFLYSLCYPAAYIVAEEAVDKYGSELIIGTGPFVLGGWSATKEANGRMVEQLILTRNESYHGYDTLGNQLPYLDTIHISFINSQKRELEMFQDKKLDILVGLPSESVRDIVEQKIAYFEQDPPVFILERTADMSTNYYVFNLTKDIFKDEMNGKKVRQAISYAIDRKKIVEKTLSGEAAGPGIHGITPPSFKNYDITKVAGYGYDVEKARQLMGEAGFLNGEGFPTISLKLNTGGARNVNVGMEIQKQLRQNLGINLELDIMSMDQLLEDKRNASGDIFRSGWIADFPSPENFLMLLYGKSVPEDDTAPSNLNTARYTNSTFDELYEKGLDSDSTEEKYDYFAQAEQVMMDDAPVIVLWYDEHHRLIQSNVQNLVINPMHIRDYSVVYFQEPKPRSSRAGNKENEDATAEEKVAEEGTEG